MIGQYCLSDHGNSGRTITDKIFKKKSSRACTVLPFSLQATAHVTDHLNVLNLVCILYFKSEGMKRKREMNKSIN